MNYIQGRWQPGSGEDFQSFSPGSEAAVWTGKTSTPEDVSQATLAAHQAFPDWQNTAIDERLDLLNRFAEELRKHLDELAETISLEVGKPLWEARTEVEAMMAKIPLSAQAYRERCSTVSLDLNGTRGGTFYRPLGVIAVFGPFNFPGHIANGHLVPALLAGNTVVFKPSELTPLVAEKTVRLWEAAGAPPGVINLVQGGPETGAALIQDSHLRGILFTGSLGVGVAIRKALVERPEVLLALELGGNNPLVVHDVDNIEAAVYWTIQSAFLTAGQRCTCARRLILTPGNEGFLSQLSEAVNRLAVGRPHDDPPPFMGPVIHSRAAQTILAEQQRLLDAGATSLIPLKPLPLGPAFLKPGLIDVTHCRAREDRELFGPLLQVIRVESLSDAIHEANQTRFGLVAALFSKSRDAFEQFRREIRTGLINWNRPTTGASGHLPFGGVGHSGNHRPAGYYMIDSCASPIASLESDHLLVPAVPSPGMNWT